MSEKILKKVIEDFESYPAEEVRRLIKEALEKNSIYRSLLDYQAVGHIAVNMERTILYASRSVPLLIPCDRRRRTREGMKIDSMMIDKDVKAYLLDVFKGREKPEAREFAVQVGEEARIIRVSFAAIDAEYFPFVDIILQDITEEKQKEVRLRRSESLASMTTMAAGIAHEIKNPLAAMKIHLQLMRKTLQQKKSITEEQAERYLSVLDEEIDHLNTIAVDFLFAVRPMDIELMLGSVNAVMNDLVTFLTPEADSKNIRIISMLDPFLPNIELDSRYMRQCLLNIIENAFAAMPGGGTLTLMTKLEGDFVIIRISDTGTGIAENEIQKIFEPYFTTKASGTGLGLTVVYKVIKEHRGDIFVSSQEGKGTSFTIKLPVPSSQRRAIENKEK